MFIIYAFILGVLGPVTSSPFPGKNIAPNIASGVDFKLEQGYICWLCHLKTQANNESIINYINVNDVKTLLLENEKQRYTGVGITAIENNNWNGLQETGLSIGTIQSLWLGSGEMIRNGARKIPCAILIQRTISLLDNTWTCLRSRTIVVPSVVSLKMQSLEQANVCAWLWTMTTRRAESEDCFATHVTWLLGSFPISPCLNEQSNTWLSADASYLCYVGERLGIPKKVLYAIAWMETRKNLNPRIRGALGEIGRLQLRHKSTVCIGLDIRTYEGNVWCGALFLLSRYNKYGSWSQAIKRYNGNGAQAELYLQRALAFIGRLTIEEL